MSALEVRPDPGFVVARQTLHIHKGDSRFTIPEGSLRKADDIVVQGAPEFFYAPVTHYCHVELTTYAAEDGRELGTRRITHEIQGPPAPEDPARALREVEKWWVQELQKECVVMTLEAQRSGENDWVIRAEVERAAPLDTRPVVNVTVPEPVVNVTVQVPEQPVPQVTVNIEDEPLDATVRFKRDKGGAIQSAQITDSNPEQES